MKRYLLDTHIILWYLLGQPKLPPSLVDLILNLENDVFYSVLCPWEVAIKRSAGETQAA